MPARSTQAPDDVFWWHNVRTKTAEGGDDAETADVIEQVKANFDSGVNVVAIGFGWETADDYIRQLEQVGREVIQAVR